MSVQLDNNLTFDEGVKRIDEANKKAGFDFKGKITTSLDPEWRALQEDLRLKKAPDGFLKFQLPFYLDGPSQFFLSVGEAKTKVPAHAHEGDGLRYILSGSINYQGKVLKAGDWMFIPKGKKYEFEVGPEGVSQYYCYCCTCIPK